MQISVDYFRVTVPKSVGYERIAFANGQCEPIRAAATGFAKVERVGDWYRRSEPFAPSKALGFDYESWECPGFTLPSDVAWWASHGGKCTRLDLTVDMPDTGLRPVHIRDMLAKGDLESPCEKVRLVDGDDPRNTRRGRVSTDGQTLYFGAPSSPRRLRVYEKGKQLGTPDVDLLRVEVTLKEYLAVDTFAAFAGERDLEAFRLWAAGYWCAHLVKMVSGPLIETWTKGVQAAELRSHTEDLEPWSTLTALRKQWGPVLSGLHRAGLLVEWVQSFEAGSRASEWRAGKVVKAAESDPERLMSIANLRGNYGGEKEDD